MKNILQTVSIDFLTLCPAKSLHIWHLHKLIRMLSFQRAFLNSLHQSKNDFKITLKLMSTKGYGLDGITFKIIKILCHLDMLVNRLSSITMHHSYLINLQVKTKKQELSLFIRQEIWKVRTVIDQYRSMLNCRKSIICKILLFNIIAVNITVQCFFIQEILLCKLQSGI